MTGEIKNFYDKLHELTIEFHRNISMAVAKAQQESFEKGLSQGHKVGYDKGRKEGLEIGKKLAIHPEHQEIHLCIDGKVYIRDPKDAMIYFRKLNEVDAAQVKQGLGLLNPLPEQQEGQQQPQELKIISKYPVKDNMIDPLKSEVPELDEETKRINVFSGTKVTTHQEKKEKGVISGGVDDQRVVDTANNMIKDIIKKQAKKKTEEKLPNPMMIFGESKKDKEKRLRQEAIRDCYDSDYCTHCDRSLEHCYCEDHQEIIKDHWMVKELRRDKGRDKK